MFGRLCHFSQGQSCAETERSETDLRIRCPHGPHLVTVDPNSTESIAPFVFRDLDCPDWADGLGIPEAPAAELNLSTQFGIVDQTRTHRFGRICGIRSDAEAWNNTFKSVALDSGRTLTGCQSTVVA